MFKPVTTSLLLALIFFGNACGNAKFNGTGKKKDRNNSEVTVVEPTPTPTPEPCKPGETCVVVDPGKCTPGAKDCSETPNTGNPKPPVDNCKDGKDGSKDCPTNPPQNCDDDAGQNPGQNPGQNSGHENDKTCPTDNPGQNSAQKGK